MDEAKKRHRLVGPPGLWEMKRRFQSDFLIARGLQPDDHLLDLGCGTLRGGIPLIDYLKTGHYTGIDVRPDVIGEAQQELAKFGLGHKRPSIFVAGDLKTLSIDNQFDVTWAFSVLIHMDDDILAGALEFVSRHLSGAFYANVNFGDRESAGWQGFPVTWRSLAFYREQADRAGLTVEDMGSLGELGHDSGVPAQDAQRMLKFAGR